jgi:hypothetical protein
VGAARGDQILVASTVTEDGSAWRRIVAHEAAHTVQQARGAAGEADALDAGENDRLLELNAEAAATAALAGRRFPGLLPVRPEREPVLQCFNAWEHMLLGDLPTSELKALATQSGDWKKYAGDMVAALGLFQHNPASVKPGDVTGKKANLQVLTLAGSKCVATRGQLNAIAADYVANPGLLDSLPEPVIMGFLQQVRQEAYNRLQVMLGNEAAPNFAPFDQAICTYADPSSPLGEGLETSYIEQFTIEQGLGLNHYYGLLARNACHFAPFGWHRWRQFHEQARQIATDAYNEPSGPDKDTLTVRAWVWQCYADHFLEDAFSAGHLTNKTLVMQWFISWLLQGNGSFIQVLEWDSVQNVTTTNQPNLWGQALYDPQATILSNDPQTSEEKWRFDQRVAQTGVQAYGPLEVDQAYAQYIDFLTASSIQYSSNQVHNYFNDTGLTVKPSDPSVASYSIYGDEMLLLQSKNSTAAGQASAAVMQSQQSVADILATGSTTIQVSDLLNLLPANVYWQGGWMSLSDWHAKSSLATFCGETIFGGFKAAAVAALTDSLGPVSIDQATSGLNNRWQTDVAGSDVVSMLWNGERLFAAANGVVSQLNPDTGTKIETTNLGYQGETRLAADGQTVIAGVNGHVFALEASAIGTQKWAFDCKEFGEVVDVILPQAGGTCYASCYGYLWALSYASGSQIGYNELKGYLNYPVRLAAQVVGNQTALYGGTNGYVISINTATSDLPVSWHDTVTSGDGLTSVLVVDQQLFAGARGWVFEVNRSDGTTSKTGGLPQHGYPEVRLAANDTTLFAGANGVVTALPRSDVSQSPLWSVSPGGSGVTNLLLADGNLFVGLAGNVYQLDPATGKTLFSNNLPNQNVEVRMATDEVTLAVGTYGTAVGLALHGTSAQAEAGAPGTREEAMAPPYGSRVALVAPFSRG